MSLVLQAIALRGLPLPGPLERRFDRIGGTIGRSEDNDLMLPDPGRSISRVHARIEWRDGSYLLQDLGSNPSQLNQSPLGPARSARLAHGDVLTIGDYRLQIAIDETDAPSAPVAVSPWSTAATAPLTPASHGAGPGLDGLLDNAGGREPVRPVPPGEDDWAEAFGAGGSPALEPSPLAVDPLARTSTLIPADFDPLAMAQPASAFSSVTPVSAPTARPRPGGSPRPRTAAESRTATARSVPVPAGASAAPPSGSISGNDEVFRALLKGLGQPAAVLGNRSQADLAELAGQLLREAIDGAMALLVANTPLATEAPTLAGRDNNPLKCFPEVDSALTQMLSSRGGTYLSGPKAIWAAFEELRARERIRRDATQAALDDVLARFEPAALVRRMDGEGLPGGWRAGGRAARYWQGLPAAHAAIVREAQATLRRVDDPLSFGTDDYSAARKNVVEP